MLKTDAVRLAQQIGKRGGIAWMSSQQLTGSSTRTSWHTVRHSSWWPCTTTTMYYHDENCWMPEVMCDHILRAAEYLDPRLVVGYDLPLTEEIDYELPF